MYSLLVSTASFREPVTAFDGLSDNATGWTEVGCEACRVRQLSAREMYLPQGDNAVSTHRINILGSLIDKPYVKANNYAVIDDIWYRIQTINQARTRQDHHLQLDCIVVEGAPR